ncbi:hypothetical protein Tco_0052224 [Tanacetum coccineum]
MRSLQMDVDDEISNLVDLHMGMFGGGWKWQDLQGLLWLDHHKNSDKLRHDQKCKNMKRPQDMQLIQKLRDDQKRMKKVFEAMSGRNIVTNSRMTSSWREIVSLIFSEVGVLHGQGEVKGGGVDFGVINSLLGEILGEVMGEME